MGLAKIVAGVVAVILVIVVLIAPIGPLPGFFIGGDQTPAPAAWASTQDVHEIELEVGAIYVFKSNSLALNYNSMRGYYHKQNIYSKSESRLLKH